MRTLLALCLTFSLAAPALAEPLTKESVQTTYASLRGELKSLPPEPEEWIRVMRRWNDWKAVLAGEVARRELREAQNTADKAAEEAASFMRQTIAPIQEENDAAFRQALLSSPCRQALEDKFGKLLFTQFEVAQSAFEPKNLQLNTQISDLESKYSKLVGGAKVVVNGQEMTMTRALALLDHSSEAKRKAAWEAVNQWTFAHANELQGIYSAMIEKRHQVALNLGEKNYVPVAYKTRRRTDFGPKEVKRFREEIKKYVVPLLSRLRRKQAEMLGQRTVKPWNQDYFPGMSLDPNILKVSEELPNAQRMFDRLHPRLGDRFRLMRQQGAIDLENRANKMPGAFCDSSPDDKKVFVFCNSTGSRDDVSTLSHEMGHAFQKWDSMWIEPIELRRPTSESSEILSTGMEYLSLPLLGEFFKPADAAKVRKLRLMDTLTWIPYEATVDEFQHWVYEHPKNTPAQRDAAWSRISDSYNVGIDWKGVEKAKAVRWKRQNHIFQNPFYYIDYAIAESGALQLFAADRKDHGKAMQSYLALCKVGGSQSTLGLFKTGGLKNPFSPGVLKPLMEAIATDLKI